MNDDAFEKDMRGQTIRPIPASWREEIVQTAQAALRQTTCVQEGLVPVAWFLWWQKWLWPRPAAWAALGASWLVIMGVTLTTSRPGVAASTDRSVAQSHSTATLPEQRQLLSQVLDPATPPAAPAGSSLPRRRSERRLERIAV